VIKYLQIVFHSGLEAKLVTALNGMRKKRHRIVYEERDIVSESEAKRSIEWAEKLIATIGGMI